MANAQSKLETAMSKVDWTKNTIDFFNKDQQVERLEKTATRLAVMARQIEKNEGENPAIGFVREMQVSAQNCCALIALGIYKPAAASIRTIFESFMYYTFFRSHPVELATLSRRTGYYIDKKEVILFHKEHTENFTERQQSLGLVTRTEKWYSTISAIVHGQVPGEWLGHTAIDQISFSDELANLAVEMFVECEDIARRLFLCTFAQDIWAGVPSSARTALLFSLTGPQRVALGLDSH